MTTHPRTGLRYIVYIPSALAFQQVRVCYDALATRSPWLEVVSEHEFAARFHATADDPRTFFLLWGFSNPEIRGPRRARAALVHCEPLGPFDKMLPQHIDWLAKIWKDLPYFDAVFLHTPAMVERMQQMVSTPAYLLPVGWDPCMGLPDFDRPKTRDLVYWGSDAGRRTTLLPVLKTLLGDKLHDASGSFGPQLHDALQGAKAGLYIGHSDVANVSTFRIWQSLVTSAPLLAEGWDWWPLREHDHYLRLPVVTHDNLAEVAELIRYYLTLDLLAAARGVWHDMEPYTIDNCVAAYLLPASAEIAGKPRTSP